MGGRAAETDLRRLKGINVKVIQATKPYHPGVSIFFSSNTKRAAANPAAALSVFGEKKMETPG